MCECVFRTPIYNLSHLPHALHPARLLQCFSIAGVHTSKFVLHSLACSSLRRTNTHIHILSLSIFISLLPLVYCFIDNNAIEAAATAAICEYFYWIYEHAMRYSHANRVRIAITLFVYEHQVRANTQHFIRLNEEEEEAHLCTLTHNESIKY